MKIGHGGRLYVLLPQHLHLHRRVGELAGEVVQEVGEVGGRSMDNSHHEARGVSLVLAERQGHELLGEALHLGRRQAGELLDVGVCHRGASVGLLLDVDQLAELQPRQPWRRGTAQRGAVAEAIPDRGGDAVGGSGRDSRVLAVLWGHVSAAAVSVHLTEGLGQTKRKPRTHSLARAVIHFGTAVPLLRSLTIFVLLFLLLLEFLQQQVLL